MKIEAPEIKLAIREEELDLIMKWIKTGEVIWHKEVLTEEKTFTVPVRREELVIEKPCLDAETLTPSSPTEIIRIPLREERVNFTKCTYDLAQVDVFKNQILQFESVAVNIKKEVVNIHSIPNADVKIENQFKEPY